MSLATPLLLEKLPEKSLEKIVAIVPAAGIGSRMGSAVPKQYLELGDQPIIGHTLDRLLQHSNITNVVVALHANDHHFALLPQAKHQKISCVIGGENRADSVIAALNTLDENTWVLVHDAARPCITQNDIDKLIAASKNHSQGAILAVPVKDTMKRTNQNHCIIETVCREQLWHALTPQMFQSAQLIHNLRSALAANVKVTDEASAMEWAGISPYLVTGRADNIKVTHPDDLAMAQLFLMAQKQASLIELES